MVVIIIITAKTWKIYKTDTYECDKKIMFLTQQNGHNNNKIYFAKNNSG